MLLYCQVFNFYPTIYVMRGDVASGTVEVTRRKVCSSVSLGLHTFGCVAPAHATTRWGRNTGG